MLSLPLFALDQLTKLWVLRHIPREAPRIIVPGWFALVNITNTGAAFGSFQNKNFLFVALSAVALIVVLAQFLRGGHSKDAWRDASLALLFGGVLGNLADRLAHGHVIDFLLFDLHVPLAHPWPAFNVADSCICAAVFSFVIYWLRANGARPADT